MTPSGVLRYYDTGRVANVCQDDRANVTTSITISATPLRAVQLRVPTEAHWHPPVHLFKWAGHEIDKDIATCILTTIMTDTGGFMHITPRLKFRASAEFDLSRCG